MNINIRGVATKLLLEGQSFCNDDVIATMTSLLLKSPKLLGGGICPPPPVAAPLINIDNEVLNIDIV